MYQHLIDLQDNANDFYDLSYRARPSFQKNSQQYEESYQAFCNSLSPTQRQLFDHYVKCDITLKCYENNSDFVAGMRYCAILMTELFL